MYRLLPLLVILACCRCLLTAEPASKLTPTSASANVVLSAIANKLKAGEPVKLTLLVRDANTEVNVEKGIVELRPEGGKYDLMRVLPVAKRQGGQSDSRDQVWELVIAGDADIEVWERNPASSMMLPPIKGLSPGKYKLRWFGNFTPVDWKYKSNEIGIEIVEADRPISASKPATMPTTTQATTH